MNTTIKNTWGHYGIVIVIKSTYRINNILRQFVKDCTFTTMLRFMLDKKKFFTVISMFNLFAHP